MSDKPYEHLWEVDRRLRRLRRPLGPGTEGTQFIIELVSGFELFNTRPYHNFENWSDGWCITVPWIILHWPGGQDRPLTVEAEDLDQAVDMLESAMERYRAHPDWPGSVVMGYTRPPEEE